MNLCAKKNILVNFLGRGCSAAALFFSTPIFVQIVGIEAYGLIGLYQAFLGLMLSFDFGVGMTVIREIARGGDRLGIFLRTVERYWLLVCGGMWGISLCLSGMLKGYCLHKQTIGAFDHPLLFQFFLTALFTYWPILFYSAVLTGYGKQVRLNGVNVVCTVLRFGGAIVLLWWKGGLAWFFTWQIVVNVMQIAVMRKRRKERIDWKCVKGRWKFTFSLALISMFGVAFSQLDKVILVRILPMKSFGEYCVVASLAMGILTLIGPFYHVLYPHFAKLVKEKKREELIDSYVMMRRIVNGVTFSFFFFVVFFGENVLLSWTGNREIAEGSWIVLDLLAGAFACFALLHIPHALQLAYGWSRLHLVLNVSVFCVWVPLLIVLSMKFGAVGAGIALVSSYGCMAVLSIVIMHRKILRGVGKGVLEPLCLAGCVSGLMKLFMRGSSYGLVVLGFSFLAIALVSCGYLRKVFFDFWFRTGRKAKGF